MSKALKAAMEANDADAVRNNVRRIRQPVFRPEVPLMIQSVRWRLGHQVTGDAGFDVNAFHELIGRWKQRAV